MDQQANQLPVNNSSFEQPRTGKREELSFASRKQSNKLTTYRLAWMPQQTHQSPDQLCVFPLNVRIIKAGLEVDRNPSELL
jgi:hypothetical protein